MPNFHTRRVVELIGDRPGIQRVRLDDGSRAYSVVALTGGVELGDDVVVNTTAVDLGLGTGGWHVVHWNLSRRDLLAPGRGHIMKLRYTSLQADTGAAEEDEPSETEQHDATPVLPDLRATPVLVGGLHSQVGVLAAVLARVAPMAKVSYVMTDGAALPLALSDLVADLRARALLAGTVTCGHAFGGELEAVSVPSGLHLAVARQRADVVICAMGPGVVGTATPLGTTAVEVAPIVDAVAVLGGRPVVVARASEADPRPRHRGISHHTHTALALSSRAADVPVPADSGLAASVAAPHRGVEVDVDAAVGDVAALLDGMGLRVTTMGRGPLDDPLSFRTVAAAAVHAAHLLAGSGTVAPA